MYSREGDIAVAKEIISKGMPVKFERTKKALITAQKFIEQIYANPGMTPDEKRFLIDKTYMEMIAMSEATNKAIENLYKRRK